MRAFIVLASCGVVSLCAILAACGGDEQPPGEQPAANDGGPGATDSGTTKPGADPDAGTTSPADSGKPGVAPRDQWVRLSTPAPGDLATVRIVNSSTIWIGGKAGMFRSDGVSVKDVDLGVPVSIGGIALGPGGAAVAVGASGGKAVAFNGGNPWANYSPPSTVLLEGLGSVAAQGSRDFVACSDDGTPINFDSTAIFGSPNTYRIQGYLDDCWRVAKDVSGGYWLASPYRLYYYDTRNLHGFSVATNDLTSYSGEQLMISVHDMATVTDSGKTALYIGGSGTQQDGSSSKARIMRRVGQAPFETITSARTETITAIAPLTSDDAWFATAGGAIGRYKAGSWRWGSLPGGGVPTAMDAIGERVWVVGKDGAVWFCQGACDTGFQTEGGGPGPSDGGTTDAGPLVNQAATYVTAGGSQSCARLDDGTTRCWGVATGFGDNVTRGDGPNEMGSKLPAIDLGAGTAVEYALGSAHSCARLDTGAVKCWGTNGSGQLGVGDKLPRGSAPNQMGNNLPAVDFGAGRAALQIVAGHSHSCARLDSGQVTCWGYNNYGQLGLGNTTPRGGLAGDMGAGLAFVDLGPGRTAVHIGAGQNHTCAALDDGSVKCWGYGSDGQLGVGDTNGRGGMAGQMGANLPAAMLGGGNAVQVAGGSEHSCARFDNGTVKCWGTNLFGQLGLGNKTHRIFPNQLGANLPVVDLGTGRTAVEIGVGELHTCARLDNGTVKCWGYSYEGRLGLGVLAHRGGSADMGNQLPALDFGPGRTVQRVSVAKQHSCALLDNGLVKCWGGNAWGQLGLGDQFNRGHKAGDMGANLPAVQFK